MMTRDEVLNLMASLEGWVRGRILTAIRQIILLLATHPYEGQTFRFDEDEELNKAVDDLLKQLTDAIEEEITRRANLASDDDYDVPYLLTSREVRDRLEAHTDNLKRIAETFIATMIAKKISPFLQPALFPAYMETSSQSFGKGVASNPAKGMGFVGKDFIYLAYTDNLIKGFQQKGAIGYYVYRGSGYDCELCDDICYEGGIRKLYTFMEDIPIPAHPHCVCYVVPVYPE